MRKPCLQCAMKHLAQAEILLEEAALGYPDHYFLAIGHLAEAESEVLGVSIEAATEIRAARLALEHTSLPYSDLLELLKSLETETQSHAKISSEEFTNRFKSMNRKDALD